MHSEKSSNLNTHSPKKFSHKKKNTEGRTTRTAQKRTNRENFPHKAKKKKRDGYATRDQKQK